MEIWRRRKTSLGTLVFNCSAWKQTVKVSLKVNLWRNQKSKKSQENKISFPQIKFQKNLLRFPKIKGRGSSKCHFWILCPQNIKIWKLQYYFWSCTQNWTNLNINLFKIKWQKYMSLAPYCLNINSELKQCTVWLYNSAETDGGPKSWTYKCRQPLQAN